MRKLFSLPCCLHNAVNVFLPLRVVPQSFCYICFCGFSISCSPPPPLGLPRVPARRLQTRRDGLPLRPPLHRLLRVHGRRRLRHHLHGPREGSLRPETPADTSTGRSISSRRRPRRLSQPVTSAPVTTTSASTVAQQQLQLLQQQQQAAALLNAAEQASHTSMNAANLVRRTTNFFSLALNEFQCAFLELSAPIFSQIWVEGIIKILLMH